jgi:hypothetical protein
MTAKPSNAVLLEEGLVDGDKISSAQTLFTEFNVEIFSLGNFKEILSIRLKAS